MENNRIELVGKVCKNFKFEYSAYGENFYSLIVEVERTSGVYDTIRTICSDRIIDVHGDLTGQFVSVTGSIRTYNKHDGDKSHLIVNVFVDELYVIYDECMGENDVFIEGYICKKSEKRTTPLGRTITDFTLATHHNCGKSYYIPTIAWGRNAAYVDKLNIGDHVKITGRLQSRNYEKNGTQTAYELSVQTIEIVE